MFRVRVLDDVARAGLDRFPPERYRIGPEVERPHAILLRSADLRAAPLPDSVQAVARAGVGVNNVPVERLSEAGAPVFNTPGANANAVKELVLAGLLMAARNVLPALRFVHALDVEGEALERAVEEGKRRFDGFELPGKVLGVVGLGAVGVRVANAARALGMDVIGYDPQLTLTRAWELSSEVRPAGSLEELLGRAHAVSLHVPLVDATRNLVSAERMRRFRGPVVLLNFSRAEVVDEGAVRDGLDSGRILAYVTDFPSPAFRGDNRAIQLPHLGASTREARESCAIMAAERLRGFLEEGNVEGSVNFPDAAMPRNGAVRLAIANRNVPNVLSRISSALGEAGHNIVDMLNKSRAAIAYTLVDVERPVEPEVIARVAATPGVLSLRVIAAEPEPGPEPGSGADPGAGPAAGPELGSEAGAAA